MCIEIEVDIVQKNLHNALGAPKDHADKVRANTLIVTSTEAEELEKESQMQTRLNPRKPTT